MKVCFETFGCRLNKAEALQMEAEYLAKGWELTDSHKDANLIVVRGCSVTSSAQHDCERLIAHLRKHYPLVPLRICGCLDDKRLREIGLESSKIPLVYAKVLKRSGPPGTMPEDTPVPTRTARAYLKVQDGCAGSCTFCIVPKFRGKSVSVPHDQVLDKAKRFIEAGYHEIVVTGCNLSLYASQGLRLPELLAALSAIAGERCRIRLGSLEPGECALDVVRTMAESKNICRFLHIPVQSGANRVLAAMRRPYLIREVDRIVEEARRLMPTIGIGCDIMTGFPGESQLDFQTTLGMFKRLRFSNAHIFPYSQRPGTPAAKFSESVSREVRVARARELTKLAKSCRAEFAKSFLGKTVEVIVEDTAKCVGWTGEYLRCEAELGTAERKSSARIFVKKVDGDKLLGRIVRS